MSANINDSPIPFHTLSITEAEEEAVLRVMRSGWLTTGQETLTFEKELGNFYGVRHALAVSSATAGLFLSLQSLDITEGDFVILPSYTFVSCANVVEHLGANVLLADSTDDYSIDLNQVESYLQAYGSKIKAILVVHFAGLSYNMPPLLLLSDRYNVPVIEDGAHTFPMRQKKEGPRGKALVLSFYATKTLATGEGGVILTDDDNLAKKVQLMRLHGIDRVVWQRYQQSKNKTAPSWEYDVLAPGYKMNFPDILAAIGRVQLTRGMELYEKRKIIASYYNDSLSSDETLSSLYTLPPIHSFHSWHLYCLRVCYKNQILVSPSTKARDILFEYLTEQGIGCSVHFIPIHRLEYYQKKYKWKVEDFPVANSLFTSSLSLPIFPSMTVEQQSYVVKHLTIGAEKIRQKL